MKLRLSNSRGYALFLALLPVIMMYRIPGVNIGAATFLILAGMLYAIAACLKSQVFSGIGMLIPLILYFVYIATKSVGLSIILYIAIIIHLIAIAGGTVNTSALRKYIETIAVIAAGCVATQFFVHLLFGTHIPLIAYDLCIDEIQKLYGMNIATGIGRYESLYRPSAFFLEPSHFANYCSIGLMSSLLVDKIDYKKALVITAGVLMTTSGMGIVIVAVVWCAFPFLASRDMDMRKLRRVILLGCTGIAAVMVLMQIPFFQRTVQRIGLTSSASNGQYNAIWGRTLYWDQYIAPMSGGELLLGYGQAELPEVYFTGLMECIYCYGIVGVALLLLALIVIFRRSKNTTGRLMVGLYGALLPVANLTGFIYVVFFMGSTIAIAAVERKKSP